MKNKPTTKNNDTVSASDTDSSQQQSLETGVVKRFLDWIAKGAKKTKTCPT